MLDSQARLTLGKWNWSIGPYRILLTPPLGGARKIMCPVSDRVNTHFAPIVLLGSAAILLEAFWPGYDRNYTDARPRRPSGTIRRGCGPPRRRVDLCTLAACPRKLSG